MPNCNSLIIECHGDDALISASSVLMSPHTKALVTVMESRSSAKLPDHFASIASYSELNLPDIAYGR